MKELFNILIVCTAGTDGGPSDNALYKVGPPSNPPSSGIRTSDVYFVGDYHPESIDTI